MEIFVQKFCPAAAKIGFLALLQVTELIFIYMVFFGQVLVCLEPASWAGYFGVHFVRPALNLFGQNIFVHCCNMDGLLEWTFFGKFLTGRTLWLMSRLNHPETDNWTLFKKITSAESKKVHAEPYQSRKRVRGKLSFWNSADTASAPLPTSSDP